MSWIVHVDQELLVVNKPAGLLSVPGRGSDKQDCALTRVQADWPDALVVHRLDMATSGLMLLARGAACQRRLSLDFAARRIDKHYVALVDGRMPAAHGCIELPLSADWPHRLRPPRSKTHDSSSWLKARTKPDYRHFSTT
jgi:tRNA pseudouridine32 synthase/23S rRNA pseudouridine746 synthase